MRSWNRPNVPTLPGGGPVPRIHDTASGRLREASGDADGRAGLYVCGITPYDATHLGHAATYLAFDTLQRLWRDAGLAVRYAQNVTDVDDPLLERARETGADWRDLAAEQVDLFRADMEALAIIPPDDYVAVTDLVPEVADAVGELLASGTAYRVPTESVDGDDVYFDCAAAGRLAPWSLGEESGLDRETMLALSAERGGDPDRPGKRDPLDPLLWRAEREGEPAWETILGRGRPGWHIECSVIALDRLGPEFAVQGGGSDLAFPHHEMSAGHAAALSGRPLARLYAHAGMVAYEGEKMSKSLGNLVLVSRLRAAGADPRAVRLALLGHHYRSDWEWGDDDLRTAGERLTRWARGLAGHGPADTLTALAALRSALADDLDTPRALAVVDDALARGVADPGILRDAIRALLGVDPLAPPKA